MSFNDQRPISLEDYTSQVSADFYMDMLTQGVPQKPMDYRLVDQMVVGRQTAGIPQLGRIMTGPAALLLPQNDLKRNAIDDRVMGESKMQDKGGQLTSAQVWNLQGIESIMS